MQKNLSIIFIVLMFFLSMVFFVPHEKVYKVKDVISPVSFLLDNNLFELKEFETFDTRFTSYNKKLSEKLKISEKEAFILGNLGKQWASNLMKNRKVSVNDDNDLVYYRHGYKTKFFYSGYCLKDFEPCSKDAFDKKLFEIRRAKYNVLDLNTDKIYTLDDERILSLENFILIRKSHLPKKKVINKIQTAKDNGRVKVFLTDSTSKFFPDRECSSAICRELLKNINKSQKTIDMAIYGYSNTPVLAEALKKAVSRGVKIRLVYDVDSNGKNIYPDTLKILEIIKDNKNDGCSVESKNIMHNKFYIFDDKVLITGSANLSHTDMSGFNSNSIIVVESSEVAKIYKTEFEQMFAGKFHSEKSPKIKKNVLVSDTEMDVYFSPQDKTIINAILPLIRNSKKYIYIPTFVLTEKRVTEELIKAKQRGVDVRIIIDALNASVKHSKHNQLRQGGVFVKTENYAGKMHSKSMLIDDEYTVIGSMNFSYSGENRNDENLIVIKDSEITKFYREFFLYQWNKIDNKYLKFNVRAEGKDSIGSCFDGIDNNYDGLTDSEDPACKVGG